MRCACLLLLAAVVAKPATFYVTVAGLGGEPEYEQRFASWAQEMEKALKEGGAERIHTLSGASATRVQFEAALSAVAKEARPEDALVLALIGHGTFDGTDYKFNLPGPDVTSAELGRWLSGVPCRQLIVNMTSASGGSLAALRGPRRSIITATKSGTEKNATVFSRYWIAALRDPAADTDKSDSVNAQEVFRYAERKTAEFYQSQKRLATEHPQLDDSGKGEVLRTFMLARFGKAVADPAKRELLAKKERLEQQIDRLKYEKAAMPADVYKKQLTALLLELAKTQAELDK